jgi:23S rRNA A2030 N6-methylase RlmJ
MDYAHARHAGNAGDVLKHVALVALLEAMLRDPAPLAADAW